MGLPVGAEILELEAALWLRRTSTRLSGLEAALMHSAGLIREMKDMTHALSAHEAPAEAGKNRQLIARLFEAAGRGDRSTTAPAAIDSDTGGVQPRM